MKKTSRKRRLRAATPTPDQIQAYIQAMNEQHQLEWRAELKSSAPHWEYLLGLHLRLVELEHLESGSAELL